jgi:hypothetical protein
MVIRLSSEHRRLLTSLRRKAEQAKPAGGATALREFLASKAAAAAEIEDETDDETVGAV